MASNELRARVSLDVSGAERKLSSLIKKIEQVNAAVKGTSSGSGLDAKVSKVAQSANIAQQEIKKMASATTQVEQRTDAVYRNSLKIAQAKAMEQQQSQQELAAIKQRLLAEDQAAKAKIKAQQIANQAAERQRKQQAQLAAQQEKSAQREKRLAEQAALAQEKAARRKKLAEEKAARDAQKAWEKANEQAVSDAEKVVNVFKKIGMLALGVSGATSLGNYIKDNSDTITGAENRLNYANGGDTAATEEAMDKMYAASLRSRTDYGDMMSNVGKSMALAGDTAFQGNIDNAIRFQEVMAKSYAIGGASAAEQASSMYQMVQALGSGVLQGDELRSVREGAPLAYQAIEEFAQGVYDTNESLKDLASEGKITSDIVVAAMMQAGGSIDKAFEDTNMTIAQAFTNLKSVALNSFRPIQDKINEFLNSDAGATFLNGLTNVIQVVSAALYGIVSIITWIATIIANNWSWLKPIFIAIAVILGIISVALLTTGIMAFFAGLKAKIAGNQALMAWMKALWPLFLIIAVIAIVASVLSALGISFDQVCGFIVGVIMGAVSVIWNILVTLLTFMIKKIVLPIATAWELFANFFGNIFKDPIATIIHSFETLANSVLSILKTIASGIDAIFGTDVANKVQGWMDSVSGKANELADKYGNGKYEKKSDAVNAINDVLDSVQTKLMWNTSDAYKTGYSWGETGANWVTDKIGNIKNSLGLDGMADLTDPATALDTTDYDPGNLAKDVNNIDDNTGAIKDSMELTEEDLEYLRKVADMEWKKEYTTAAITVDMSNYNTINGEGDLDGIVTKLADKLYEEMDYLANGTYA